MNEVIARAKTANLIGLLLIIPFSLAFILPFWIKWSEQSLIVVKEINIALSFFDNTIIDSVVIIISPVILVSIGVVIHELIHGLFMLLFSKRPDSIKFGFRKDVFIPFTHCKVPLGSGQMFIVVIAPWIILGLIPFVLSMNNGNPVVWFIGFSMTLAAIGDFVYAFLILKTGFNVRIIDHDKEIGFKIVD
jgi:hypothetical protein